MLETYLDFAENDYQFFKTNYEHHIVANQMCTIAQIACEKYLKYVIQEYWTEDSSYFDAKKKEELLFTHNINSLIYNAKKHVPRFHICTEDVKAVCNYYYNSRYPGDDAVTATMDDIEICNTAVILCRDAVMTYINRGYKPKKSFKKNSRKRRNYKKQKCA